MPLAGLKHAVIDGKLVAYRDQGQGPAILLLHGLGGNSASWEPQFELLSGSHRVVAWDMPGFGGSDLLPRKPATTHDYSHLAVQLLDTLDITTAYGVGTSYGTVILADLVQGNPHRIMGMIFACGVTGMGHLPEDKRAALRATRRDEIGSMGQRKFAETRNSTYVARGLPPSTVQRVVELAASAQPEGYLQAYGALTESNIFSSLAAIKIPALVLSGANDPIAPAADCERVAKALAHAEYHCIPNSGHYVNLEQTEIFNRLLAEFIRRCEAAGPATARKSSQL